jgi:oligopeptide transport system substrate-binding protein
LIVFRALNLIKKRLRRFPKLYDRELLIEVLMHTLVSIGKTFLAKRSLKDLERLIYLQYHLQKRIEVSEGSSRLMARIFLSQVDESQVLSIAIGVRLMHSQEILQERHIYRALVCLIPGIRVIPGSFYSCRDERDGLFLFCYLEIEKLRGSNLTFKDIELLRGRLPLELDESIQSLTFSLLFSYNEEDLYKSALQLARELRSERDPPQVMIFFQAQVHAVLRFSVVLVRIKKRETIKKSSLPLPSSSRLTIQRTISFGHKKRSYAKEALIFSLETDCSLFLRKNWAIDLNQARNYTAKVVEQLFGPFRDYNGGLLLQQSKQLEEIKKELRGRYENFYPLIQKLFHSFTPPSFQALLCASTAKRFFAFFVAFLGSDTSLEAVVMKKKNSLNSMFFLIRLLSSESLDVLVEELKNLQKEAHSSIGYSYFEFEKKHYLSLVDLNNTLSVDVMHHLKGALQKKRRVKKREDYILRLNFQDGDPPSLNPQIAIDQRCRSLGRALFEGLTRLNPQGIPEPAAAKEIKVSDDQKVYTFILKNLYWSNGEEVSAFDFEQTWKRAIAPSSNCLRSDLFYIIKNARLANRGTKPLSEVKIKAVNSKKLVIELEYPAFHFLHLLAHPIFSPIYKGEQEPTIFNGPFLLKEWKRDHFLQLTSNPYYWDKKNVQLKDISISMINDEKSIGELFEKRDLDWLGEPFSACGRKTLPLGDHRAWKRGKVSDQMYWIYLNTKTFPLFSVNIRKALACAINRKEMAKKCRVKECLLHSEIRSPSNTFSRWDGNSFLARGFFEAGLKELGISRETFPEITLYWSALTEQDWIRMIQEQIEVTLNIKIVLKHIEWKQLSYLLDKREYQMATCYRSSLYYPRAYLELFRENSNLYNSSQWESPIYKALIDRALQSWDQEERERCLIEAEQIFLEEMPVIPLVFPTYFYRLGNRVKKAAIASNGDVDLKWVSIQ